MRPANIPLRLDFEKMIDTMTVKLYRNEVRRTVLTNPDSYDNVLRTFPELRAVLEEEREIELQNMSETETDLDSFGGCRI